MCRWLLAFGCVLVMHGCGKSGDGAAEPGAASDAQARSASGASWGAHTGCGNVNIINPNPSPAHHLEPVGGGQYGFGHIDTAAYNQPIVAENTLGQGFWGKPLNDVK